MVLPVEEDNSLSVVTGRQSQATPLSRHIILSRTAVK
jgi:hypothetical protein